MNTDQSFQLLSWLDEEHRKDKTMMSEILSQLDQHLTQITGLTRGLQDLEERLARVQNQSLRYSQIEQALGQVKTEVTLLFEQFNQRVQQREEDAFKLRLQERERLDKAVEALSANLEQLVQEQRNLVVDKQAVKRVEGGQVAFVRGLEEMSKRQEATNARLQVTEEWVKRTGALIAEVQQLSERLRQDRADALEATRRADQMRARQITEWTEQMKVTRREMDDWLSQLRPLLDLPKETRGYLAQLRELEEQLKQVEPRLSQRQKLNEEFSRREIGAIKSEMEKRWQQQTNDWEFMRDEWSKKIAAMGTRFDPIDEWRPAVMEEFRLLREKVDGERQRFFGLVTDVVRMQVEFDRTANARFEQFASDLLTRVETEKAAAKVKKTPTSSANP
jgi:DNA repair exonuclease SbcCD ATPase subunit